jgi:hypothetical protein
MGLSELATFTSVQHTWTPRHGGLRRPPQLHLGRARNRRAPFLEQFEKVPRGRLLVGVSPSGGLGCIRKKADPQRPSALFFLNPCRTERSEE